jgi:pimeloyl-ACP methyl ester carboxylesterase
MRVRAPRGLLAAALLVLGCGAEPGEQLDTSSSGTGETETGPPADLPGDSADGPGDLPEDGSGDCGELEALVASLAAEPDAAAQTQLIDGFVRELGYGDHGFPLVEDTRLCVVYRGEQVEQVSVAGDFDGWDATDHVLSEAAPGFGYAIIELDGPPQGLYKLVRGGSEFFADPLARRFGFDEFGEYSQIDPLPGRSHHERWLGFDIGAGELEARTVTAWVPADGLAGDPLPVLYMHDGQNLFAPDALFGGWQVGPTLDEAIGSGTLAPLIVVGIDNTAARFDEYTQVTDVIEGMEVGGRADAYADFLVDGVKPFIEARYPAASTPESVAVMGSSLGGLVSLYIGLRHADVFGAVASMSGTVTWGTIGAANPTILDAYLAAPPSGLRIYLDSGGGPGLGCPEGSSDNYCGNVEFADALRNLGWVDEQDLFYRWEPDAPHNEAAWAQRLLPALVDWF